MYHYVGDEGDVADDVDFEDAFNNPLAQKKTSLPAEAPYEPQRGQVPTIPAFVPDWRAVNPNKTPTPAVPANPDFKPGWNNWQTGNVPTAPQFNQR